MTSHVSRHLSRLWRSIPLPTLQQGSTLSIHSRLSQTGTHIIIRPEWRSDGHVEMKQVFATKQNSACGDTKEVTDLVVEQHQDAETSLGRKAPLIGISLLPKHHSLAETFSLKNVPLSSSVLSYPSNPVDKVILDDGSILPDSKAFSPPPEGMRRMDYRDGVAHVTSDDAQQEEQAGTYLSLQVPEKTNVVCDLRCGGGSITVDGKVEGDVRLVTSNGDIRVTKLRGNSIYLETKNENVIFVRDVIEGQKVTVHTQGRFRAKQVHGSSIEISACSKDASPLEQYPVQLLDEDDQGSLVDVGSMYIAGNGGAVVSAKADTTQAIRRRAVRIKSSHGPLSVETQNFTRAISTSENSIRSDEEERDFPLVELGGVNGSVEIDISGESGVAGSELPVDSVSCLLHVDSLSSGTASLVTASQGDVSVSLDRKVEADLRLLSVRTGATNELTALANIIADEEESDQVTTKLLECLRVKQLPGKEASPTNRISVDTGAFSERTKHRLTTEQLEYVDGWVENKSEEPDSRFDVMVRGGSKGSVGKIRLEGAAEQALHGFEDVRASDDVQSVLRPLIAVAGTQRIVVETLSWLGAIARRYGLAESEKRVGRTASRRGRPLSDKNE